MKAVVTVTHQSITPEEREKRMELIIKTAAKLVAEHSKIGGEKNHGDQRQADRRSA